MTRVKATATAVFANSGGTVASSSVFQRAGGNVIARDLPRVVVVRCQAGGKRRRSNGTAWSSEGLRHCDNSCGAAPAEAVWRWYRRGPAVRVSAVAEFGGVQIDSLMRRRRDGLPRGG